MTLASARQLEREPAISMVEIDSTPLPAALASALTEVNITLSRAQAATGYLSFSSYRKENGDWSPQDSELLRPWKPITVNARFGDRQEEVLRGFITNIHADYPSEMGAASVTVSLQDETVALDRLHIRRVWKANGGTINDAQIVRELAREIFTSVDADQGLSHQSLSQDSTAATFIRQRAEALGYEFYARNGTLYFQRPSLDGDPQTPIRMYAGPQSNCSHIYLSYKGHSPDRVRLDHAMESAGVQSARFSPNQPLLGAESSESGQPGLPPFEWRMLRPVGASRSQLEASAQAAANRNSWRLSIEGELDGARYGHVLQSHQLVNVEGIGSTYSGTYYVDEVSHIFSSGAYRQQFRLLRNATGNRIGGEANE